MNVEAQKEIAWTFENDEIKVNYNVTNNGSKIEFAIEDENQFAERSTILQLSQPITQCTSEIIFKIKINDLGKNKKGNEDSGIQIGLAPIKPCAQLSKISSQHGSKARREKRMEAGVWYDPYNGGIYHYKKTPKQFVEVCNQDDVIEWKIVNIEKNDSNIMMKTSLYLNNKPVGESISINENVDIYPSIFLASPTAKLTIEILGFDYFRAGIEYPDESEEEGL